MSDSNPIRVLIWHEYRHEKVNPAVAAIYPDGMHNAIARYLATDASLVVETATLDEPGHGLSPSAGQYRLADLVGPHGPW